jgi:CRISPR/Cas system-associated exonuclease Cas4 (RecB family)
MQFSFSKVAQYARCPKQYEFQRLLHLPSPSAAPMVYGTAMHEAVAALGKWHIQYSPAMLTSRVEGSDNAAKTYNLTARPSPSDAFSDVPTAEELEVQVANEWAMILTGCLEPRAAEYQNVLDIPALRTREEALLLAVTFLEIMENEYGTQYNIEAYADVAATEAAGEWVGSGGGGGGVFTSWEHFSGLVHRGLRGLQEYHKRVLLEQLRLHYTASPAIAPTIAPAPAAAPGKTTAKKSTTTPAKMPAKKKAADGRTKEPTKEATTVVVPLPWMVESLFHVAIPEVGPGATLLGYWDRLEADVDLTEATLANATYTGAGNGSGTGVANESATVVLGASGYAPMVREGRTSEELAASARVAFNDPVPSWYAKTQQAPTFGLGSPPTAAAYGNTVSEELFAPEALLGENWSLKPPLASCGTDDTLGDFGAGIVVEYKSHTKMGPASLAKSTAKLQLQLYSLAYQRTFGVRPKEVRLEIIETGKTHSFCGDDQSDAEALAQVRAAAEGVSAGLFPPTPSFMGCKFCAYKSICPSTGW